MIDAKDLRIGNLITDGTYQILRVNTVYEKYVTVDGRVSCHYSDLIRGIELTPEILEAAGFKYREHLDDHYIRISEFNDRNDILILSKYNTLVCASNSQPVFFKHVTSLHQLQNLYHSLTGEEIKIKLPTTGKE